ncbi:MAG: hypothetical protein NC913_02645 [Candidatus Omnitrophica bacterium]|nr:hypothetical protein [Candidatus Omnitrophota bacterium]
MKSLPDPEIVAAQEAQIINRARHYYLEAGIERILSDAPWVQKQHILSGVENFYKEAMSKIPSFTRYPEARYWVDYVIKRDKKLMELASLSFQDIAVLRSLHDFLTFRGYRDFGLKRKNIDEKCRVAFLPETDMGPMHIKNVDDPITYWEPEPPLPPKGHISRSIWYGKPFVIDGVGSGLHIDDEPEEIFPLPVREMVYHYADDTFSAVNFFKKYSNFWGGANLLIYDRKLNSVAIEKCSRNYFEFFGPDEKAGFTHVSGMVCRNSDSPQAHYQKEKRLFYRKLFNLPDDGPDALFWQACDKLESILKETLRSLGKTPKSSDVIELFTSPYPSGLRKDGLRLHPQQGLVSYTLKTNCYFFEKKLYYRWQRKSAEHNGIWQEEPEICQYEI